jgi:glyoxylase-like metal-dependent hydrolase (beta-lactamase superfamily II)
MKNSILALGLMWGFCAAAAMPRTSLWRLDCGSFVTKGLTNSCYLVRHDNDYMLWDAGFGTELLGRPQEHGKGSWIELKQALAAQLAALGLRPGQIGILGISHTHFDHIGQAADFPSAHLVVGREDWEAMRAQSPDETSESQRLKPWVSGGAPKELIDGDKDVFGDGSVVMIATPGHTPGHHSLLVRLKHSGAILLTGDLYYSAQQYAQDEVPKHNSSVAATLASFARFRTLAKSTQATIVIQHEPADVSKLPPFPNAAE